MGEHLEKQFRHIETRKLSAAEIETFFGNNEYRDVSEWIKKARNLGYEEFFLIKNFSHKDGIESTYLEQPDLREAAIGASQYHLSDELIATIFYNLSGPLYLVAAGEELEVSKNEKNGDDRGE